jgi:peptide/nickel transport system substrate-binding protein
MLNRKIHSSATTADYNSGKVGIGIGPFRLASYRPNDRIITNSAAGMATLLAGGVDFIDQIPTGDIGRLCADNRFRVAEATSLRSMHLTLASTREPPSQG